MEARLDKWLWSVRIFKTRTIASEACKKGRVTINGVQAKPSKTVKEGDTVSVRKAPVTYTFKVLQAIENRVGAKLVPDMMQNITPQDQYDLLEMNRIAGFVKRDAGLGRPTKKDRRDMQDFLNDLDFDE
ncbi:MAG: RNA-binding S4 domain-containing protein [Bacteroidaceae bacterium]|nr:RNA-binding S4 domain-containing protein [Bacteroidaceae bacterium]